MREDFPESVVVTLVDSDSDYSTDIELPTKMPIKDLLRGILCLLRTQVPTKFAGCSSAKLWYEERRLTDEQTLASAGAWEGSVIQLRLSRDPAVVGFREKRW